MGYFLETAFFFGAALGLISCYKGFFCRAGAEGVGRATTASVVYSILWIIIADAVLTGLFFFAM